MGFCYRPGYVRQEQEKEDKRRRKENVDKWLQAWSDNLKRESEKNERDTRKTNPSPNSKAVETDCKISSLTLQPGETVKLKSSGVTIEVRVHS